MLEILGCQRGFLQVTTARDEKMPLLARKLLVHIRVRVITHARCEHVGHRKIDIVSTEQECDR